MAPREETAEGKRAGARVGQGRAPLSRDRPSRRAAADIPAPTVAAKAARPRLAHAALIATGQAQPPAFKPADACRALPAAPASPRRARSPGLIAEIS
eukprot:9229841-Pyramimonas_sp.AAC.1